MAARISVIIPVYNMEQYIEKSVRSVTNQTWQDLELIVVDDGSTDATGEILRRLANEDARIRVVHRKNGGVSAARNTGLAEASGEYVAWLDGDDWMEPTALKRLMQAIEENGASMAACNYDNVARSGAREQRYTQSENEIISGPDALRRLLRREITQSLWANLAPRAFYREIIFPEGEVFEDVRNTWRLYAQSETVALVNDAPLFSRLVREESISHVKTIAKRVASCQAYLARQRELSAFWPESAEIFVQSNAASLLLSLRQAVLRDSRAHFRAKKASIAEIARYFRTHRRAALGERPGWGKRLEYFFLTCGTRSGFYLSRIVSLPRKGGTYLR